MKGRTAWAAWKEQFLKRAMAGGRGDVVRAAKWAGVPRSTFCNWLLEFGLHPKQKGTK